MCLSLEPGIHAVSGDGFFRIMFTGCLFASLKKHAAVHVSHVKERKDKLRWRQTQHYIEALKVKKMKTPENRCYDFLSFLSYLLNYIHIQVARRTTEKLFFGLKSETFSLSLRLPLTSLTKTLGEVSGYFPRGISTFPQLAIFYFLRRSEFRGQCITI